MERRNLLRSALAAATVSIAGCSVLGGSDTVTETYEPSAADSLAIAVGQLNKAALSVNEFQDQGGNGNTEDGSDTETATDRRQFEAAGPRERIAIAREATSTAEERGAETASVTAVRKYADGVEGTVDSVANITTARDSLENAQAVLDTSGDEDVDIAAASDALETATAASADSRAAHNTAVSALESADGDRLADLDAEYDGLRSGLDTLRGFVVGVDGLAVGYDRQVAGIDALQTAQDRIDADEFDAAKQSFSSAETSLVDSATTFSDAVEQAASDLASELAEGDERSRALSSLSGGYISLLDSRDQVKMAEAVLEDDSDTGARPALTAGSEDATAAARQFSDGATVRPDEFTEEFQRAQDRATAMQSLADGYLSVLNARDHFTAAEQRLGDDASASVRTSLEAASADATTADNTFADGQGLDAALFGDELSVGRSRAGALDALATGYGQLLDGKAFLETGESAFLDDEYGRAETAFADAGSASGRADETFSQGDTDDGSGIFAAEFDRAFRRTSALQSLSDGYGLVVQGRQEAAAGREQLSQENFDTAQSQFEAAASTFAEAETAFTAGQDDAGEQFSSAVDRALCRVGHLRNAMGHFTAAAQAGDQRDPSTLRSERTAGETDLNRVEAC